MEKQEIIKIIREVLRVGKETEPKILFVLPRATKEELLTIVARFATVEE